MYDLACDSNPVALRSELFASTGCGSKLETRIEEEVMPWCGRDQCDEKKRKKETHGAGGSGGWPRARARGVSIV